MSEGMRASMTSVCADCSYHSFKIVYINVKSDFEAFPVFIVILISNLLIENIRNGFFSPSVGSKIKYVLYFNLSIFRLVNRSCANSDDEYFFCLRNADTLSFFLSWNSTKNAFTTAWSSTKGAARRARRSVRSAVRRPRHRWRPSYGLVHFKMGIEKPEAVTFSANQENVSPSRIRAFSIKLPIWLTKNLRLLITSRGIFVISVSTLLNGFLSPWVYE